MPRARPKDWAEFGERVTDADIAFANAAVTGDWVQRLNKDLPPHYRRVDALIWAVARGKAVERIVIGRPSKGERRARLEALANAAGNLVREVRECDFDTGAAIDRAKPGHDYLRMKLAGTGSAWNAHIVEELEDYIDAITKANNEVERPVLGDDPNDARKFLIKDLARVYEDLTGMKAGRSYDPIRGKSGGPFWRILGQVFEIMKFDAPYPRLVGKALKEYRK